MIMHTDPRDPNGQDLEHIIHHLGAQDGRIILSSTKVPPEVLSMLYNVADCTINISDAEGFGLGTLESLSCETPIIVNLTGGLQEQVTDGKDWFGIGIEPSSKALIGSQSVPYIHEDRVSKEDFIQALRTIYHMPEHERQRLGANGRAHVQKNYNFENFNNSWVELVDRIVEERGSYEERKMYNSWEFEELT